MKWQPIDSAPKDGTEILGWSPSRYGHGATVVRYEEWLLGDSHWRDCQMYPAYPTHWMPLPPIDAAMTANGNEGMKLVIVIIVSAVLFPAGWWFGWNSGFSDAKNICLTAIERYKK